MELVLTGPAVQTAWSLPWQQEHVSSSATETTRFELQILPRFVPASL